MDRGGGVIRVPPVVMSNGTEPVAVFNPLGYGKEAADELMAMARHHEDPFVRIAAAELLVRLAIEFPLQGPTAQAFGQAMKYREPAMPGTAERVDN